MGLKARGKLHLVGETKQISDRFQKREFVVELVDNPRYPQLVMFQLTGERCGMLDGFSVGDEVDIDFSLRGREWRSPKGETKYFNSLDVWTVEGAGGGHGPSGGDDEPPPPDGPPPDLIDDIPF
jgi:hypothetical protein